MSDYRRAIVPGGTFFLTLVTYRRTPLFSESENVFRLRVAVAQMLTERPFEIIGAVVLPEHIHFLWRLPPNDSDYSQRVSRLKVLFTRSLRGYRALPQTVSVSRRKHRESDVWQRRFWEHTIRDDVDLQRHLDYLHYNPVKHGLVACPHLWEFSSFNKWVEQGRYRPDWGCVCEGRQPEMLDFEAMAGLMGE
jgi:putative transposase